MIYWPLFSKSNWDKYSIWLMMFTALYQDWNIVAIQEIYFHDCEIKSFCLFVEVSADLREGYEYIALKVCEYVILRRKS